MNRRRQLTILAAVFGVLAVSYAVGLILNLPTAEPTIVRRFDASNATHIVAGSNTLSRKGNNGWEVSIKSNRYPADSAKVDAMLKVLSGLKATRVASRSRANWSVFQVDKAHASKLVVAGPEGSLVDLSVGVTGSDGGVYVRVGSSPEVFEVAANLGGYVSADSSYWSYLRILPKSLAVDSLQSIALSARGLSVGGESVNQSYLLVSSVVGGKSAWIVHGAPKVNLDQQKVLSLEAEIVQMVGDSFVTSTTRDTGLDHPVAEITVSDEQGGKWSILVGKRYGAQFYAKRSDEPYVYLVNQWTLHRAIPRLSTLSAGTG